MTAEFEYTLEDFKQAQAAHTRAAARSGGAARGVVLFATIVAAMAAATLLGSFVPPAWNGVVTVAIPAAFMICGIMFIVRMKPRPQPVQQFVDPKRVGAALPLRSLFGWMLFVALAVFLFMLLNRQPVTPTPGFVPPGPNSPPPPGTDPLFTIMTSLLPWVLIFGLLWFFVLRVRGAQTKRMWEQNPSLHLRKRVDADGERIVLEDGQIRSEMKWRAIRRFVETPNLFMLYTTEYLFWMVPKRALTGESVDQFRLLLQSQVQPQTQAFPVQVLPVDVTTPLPPPPLGPRL